MRVVFLGTPEFALPSLRALLRSPHQVCAVFTQPDRPAGRGQKLQPPPVKRFADQSGLKVYQPERIRREENRPLLESLSPDFLVAVAYGQLLPRWLLDLPRIAAVNVHASLLPRYRGAAPIPWAILNGDPSTGVSTMLMEESLDAGPILLQKDVSISPDLTGGELHDLLAAEGAAILIPTLDGLCDKTLVPRPQDHSKASLAPKITKEMAWIVWTDSANAIHNRIRAFNPWPVATTEFRGRQLEIFRSLPSSHSGADLAPGTFVDLTERGILVQCGQNTLLELLEVQLAGRRRVSGREFGVGARLARGELIFAAASSPSS